MATFKTFNLKPELINALTKLGYISPSWIQQRVIPKALKNDNIVAQSETGSGKTHAFLVPIINNINFETNLLEAIIFCPTRELARQTWNFAKQFCEFFPELKVSLLTSGEDRNKDLNKIETNPHIIIGTPGRIKDLISSTSIKLTNVKTIVLDEADMLADLGYIEDIDYVISGANRSQIMVFSATLKENLKNKLAKFIRVDEEIINEDVQSARTIKHFAIDIKHQDVCEATKHFLKIKNPYSIIIFCSTIELVKQLESALRKEYKYIGALYGELSPRERKSILKRFRNDEFQILISSDVGARGIDITDITEVLSVDLPSDLDYYFHRAGRTGRFGKDGYSYVFYNNDDTRKISKLIQLGINFEFLKFSNGELVSSKTIVDSRPKKTVDVELQKEINKVKAKTKSEGVKPMYKKKRKFAIEKVKKKHKREIIRKDIRRQREERYRKEAKDGRF